MGRVDVGSCEVIERRSEDLEGLVLGVGCKFS